MNSPAPIEILSAPPTNPMRALLGAQQAAFQSDMAPSFAVRRERLKRLDLLIESHANEFAAAISSDFGTRSLIEIRITETARIPLGVIRSLRVRLPAARRSTIRCCTSPRRACRSAESGHPDKATTMASSDFGNFPRKNRYFFNLASPAAALSVRHTSPRSSEY